MTKRLELVWPHKGEHVIQNPETGKWEFIGDSHLSPRPLIQIEAFGDEKGKPFNPEKDNLLIKGENLFALESLLPYYAAKVKLIYIDPPFNTGQDFKAYDDNFEHSVWLSMMKERLDIAYELLHPSGCLAIEIDDTEQAYLKALIDSKFTRNNFITTISIKRSAATGHKAINPGVVNVTEYIHLYAKDKSKWKYKRLFIPRDKYDSAYNQWIVNPDEPYTAWVFKSLPEVYAESLGYSSARLARKEKGSSIFKKGMEKFAIDNADHVIRFAIPNYEGVSAEARKYIDRSKENTGKVFCLEREEYDDMYFLNGQRILFLDSKIDSDSENGEKALVEPLTNFWPDISWQGIAKEGGVTLKKGKKPEKLIQRLIDLCCTGDNDLVLDFFAGSGTAGAVAHKMKRRWITVEAVENQVTDSVGRLQRVINGEDQTGITSQVNWKGGGGFRFLDVGAPLLVEDQETKLKIMNPHYINGPLVRAVCAVEGFLLTGDKLLHGRNGEHYAHVTEDFVDDTLVKKLKGRLKDVQFLTIYAAKGVHRRIKLPNGVQIMRINSDLVKKYTRSR